MTLHPTPSHPFQTRPRLPCGPPFPKATSMSTCARSSARSITISSLRISIPLRAAPWK